MFCNSFTSYKRPKELISIKSVLTKTKNSVSQDRSLLILFIHNVEYSLTNTQTQQKLKTASFL